MQGRQEIRWARIGQAQAGDSVEGNFLFCWPGCMARRILVPQPGIEPVLPAVEPWCLNHWIAREFYHGGKLDTMLTGVQDTQRTPNPIPSS